LAKIGLAIVAQAFAARLAEANCVTIPVVKALHPTSKAELVLVARMRGLARARSR
jgi:hypothetical protein